MENGYALVNDYVKMNNHNYHFTSYQVIYSTSQNYYTIIPQDL